MSADPVELLKLAAAGAGSMATLCGVLWWLVWPRVEEKLEHVAQQATEHTAALAPGSDLRRNAETAAGAAEQLPALVDRLDALEKHGTQLSRQHTHQLQALEIWRTATEHRLGVFEQALLALLGRELGDRLTPTTPEESERP